MDETAQEARPVDPAGVPRRFSLGALMVIVTVYSFLFGLLSSLGVSPTVFGSVAILFTGVGVAQMLLFGGKRPRDASYLAGAILCPSLLLGALLIHGRFDQAGPNTLQILAGMAYVSIVGVALGYMAGCATAGIFLVMDIVNKWRGVSGIEPEPLTEEDLADDEKWPPIDERVWRRVRPVIVSMSPIQRGRPFRRAVNCFILLAVLVGLATPISELQWWQHLLITFAVAIAPAVLIGTWLARWLAPLWCIGLGGACAVGPALLAPGIFVSSRRLISDVLPFWAFIAIGCAVGWLAAATFGWVRRWRDDICAKKQVTRSNRRLTVATAVSLLVLFGIFSFATYRVSQLPVQQAMRRLTELEAYVGDPWNDFDLDKVRYIGFDGTKVTNADLKYLFGFSNLSELSLENTGITDEGLAHVGKLERIECIVLDATRVTDAGLKHLRENRQLTWLSLVNCRIKGPGLEHIEELPIEVLHLGGSDIGDRELLHLAKYRNLRWLTLDSTRISGTGFQDLTSCPRLSRLDLSYTSVSDDGLQYLWGLTRLNHLDLTGTPVTGTGLNHLRKLGNLQYLSLDESRISDADLEDFKGLPNLTYLKLSDTQLGDAGLGSLSMCRNLSYLDLSGTQVTDAGLRSLSKCRNLADLELDGTKITDAGLAHLTRLSKLYRLTLRDTQITDAGLAHIKKLPILETLDLGGTAITDSGLQQLNGISTLCEVRVDNTQVTTDGEAKLRDTSRHCYVYGAKLAP